jgi:cytochrome c-type biogenesis protein CcmF
LLTSWNNPFRESMPVLADGKGLNPLLRHPGMVFHPPLLFLGYAGFRLPARAALAHAATNTPGGWSDLRYHA